jgi:polysaccharide export outer membrane protein
VTFRPLLFVLALAVPALGCNSALPMVPTTPSMADGFQQLEPEIPSGLDDDPPMALTLHPGDVVTLQTISAETSEVAGLTVDERGILHIPLAGDVEVAGLNLTGAEQRIEEAIRPFDRSARITLLLSEPNGQRASVIGAVTTPGRYAVVPGMRLADLLADSGGPASIEEAGFLIATANLHGARLVRDGEPLPVSLAIALTGDRRHNVRVRPGDHLYVPPELENLVSVLGEVNSAQVFRYRNGLRLSRALALAGGTTRDADHGDIVIMRGPGDNPQLYVAHFDDVLGGDAPDPVLAPGDVVYVHSSGIANFRDAIAAISPLVSLAATSGLGFAVLNGAP